MVASAKLTRVINLRQAWAHSVSQRETRMKQIVIEIEDEVYESFLSMLNLCPAIRVVSEVEIADTLAGRDVCMREAICILRGNNVFRHYYDYAWIMMAINDGVIDEFEAFQSPQKFLDYLYEIGIDKLPTRYTISLACSKTIERYPDWVFVNVNDANESLRRKNVVKQFLSAYGAAKRARFNKIFNK